MRKYSRQLLAIEAGLTARGYNSPFPDATWIIRYSQCNGGHVSCFQGKLITLGHSLKTLARTAQQQVSCSPSAHGRRHLLRSSMSARIQDTERRDSECIKELAFNSVGFLQGLGRFVLNDDLHNGFLS